MNNELVPSTLCYLGMSSGQPSISNDIDEDCLQLRVNFFDANLVIDNATEEDSGDYVVTVSSSGSIYYL